MALTKRLIKGAPLTFQEGDNNLDYLESLAINAITTGNTGSVQTLKGTLILTGSIDMAQSFTTRIFGADYISARFLAPTAVYQGVFNSGSATGSIVPVISTDWTVSNVVVGSSIFQSVKYITSDFGIGLEYNNFKSPAKAAPAIKIAYNADLSVFNTDNNIYEAGYSTIVTNNRNMSNFETARDWSYQYGVYHALTVTGSFLSRDNTNLGTNINHFTRIVGSLLVTGSAEVSGSVSISKVLNLSPQNPLPAGQLGSLAVSGSSLYFHNGSNWGVIS